MLAVIPFIGFLTPSQTDSKRPVLATSGSKSLIIEVVSDNGTSGVFFVESETSVNQMFSQLNLGKIIAEDIKLQNGTKVCLVPEDDHRGVVIKQMEAAKRLALGLPLDINLASQDDLRLIPGVGNVLAAKIVAGREQIGRFEKIDQLIDIQGIKGKKLAKLRQYLYVDKLAR